ncbi:MAG: DNA translocase FtsK [Anaerolineales bacterium]
MSAKKKSTSSHAKRTPARKSTTASKAQRFAWVKERWRAWQAQRHAAATPTRSSRTAKSAKNVRNAPEAPPRLSLDRKLDLLGIVLCTLGVLTLLSLFAGERSTLTAAWVLLLRRLLGWGAFIFPLALLGIGLWLILRDFEQVPWPSIERVIGAALGYLNLLVWMHVIVWADNRQAAFAVARAGHGGGYIGALFSELFRMGLGRSGMFVVLLAWLVLVLTFTLDRPTLMLFTWALPIGQSLKMRWERYRPQVDWHPLWTRLTSKIGTTPTESGDSAPIQGESARAEAQIPPVIPLPPEDAPTWVLPPLAEMLNPSPPPVYDDDYDVQRAQLIEETLSAFKAPARVVEINRGPTITQYGVEPDFLETRTGRTRVRVNKIASLADDLALALAAKRVRIQAPVPGKGYVGIEVPNEAPNMVALRDIIESPAFERLRSPLRFALGLDVAGNAVAANLAAMPHLLIAGATGSGKSVCVNGLITCLLLHNTPDDLRFIMVDPKRVELTGYNGIPHLLAPVVVELERVVGTLQWVTREMDMRYRKFSDLRVRNITEYNTRQEAAGEKKLPYLVVVIDELADLMMLAPDETERNITRLAQLARATGIHLVIATQRPSVDVVTGLIKANFPARIAFAVASGVDSRVILDQPGAERLLGSGDMLFQAPDAPAPVRLQGVYVSDVEIRRVVQYWRAFIQPHELAPTAISGIVDAPPVGIPLKQMALLEEIDSLAEEGDPLYAEAVDLIRRQGRVSISMLQRRLRIGYTRAARLVEEMEAQGIVSAPVPGTNERDILDWGDAAPPVDAG